MEIVFFLETLASKWFKKKKQTKNVLSMSLVEFERDGKSAPKGLWDSRKCLDGKKCNLGFVWYKTSFISEC